MGSTEDWVQIARWQIGEITNAEYADYLEERDGKDDVFSQMIVERLRALPDEVEREEDDGERQPEHELLDG